MFWHRWSEVANFRSPANAPEGVLRQDIDCNVYRSERRLQFGFLGDGGAGRAQHRGERRNSSALAAAKLGNRSQKRVGIDWLT